MTLTIVMLPVILGMAALSIDIGRLMVAKQRAQMVCDAAVLAGAWYLTGEPSSTYVDGSVGTPTAGDGLAAKTAKYAALANNEAEPSWKTYTTSGASTGVSISFPPYPAATGTVQADDGSNVAVKLGEAIRADAVVKVPLFFARLIGKQNANVHAQSTAIVGVQNQTPTPVTVTASALPFAVADTTIWNLGTNPPTTNIQMGQEVTLKIVSPNDPAGFIGSGNFLAVAYEGDQGANDYRNRLASTTPVTFYLNQEIDLETEPGNMSGPTEQGLEARIGSDIYPYPSANESAWNDWLNSFDPSTGTRADTKRVGVVPIVQDPGGTLNGRESLTLVGFAGVFIEGFESVTVGDNVYNRLTARFTGGIYTANEIIWLDPGTSPPYSSTITSVRLLK